MFSTHCFCVELFAAEEEDQAEITNSTDIFVFIPPGNLGHLESKIMRTEMEKYQNSQYIRETSAINLNNVLTNFLMAK